VPIWTVFCFFKSDQGEAGCTAGQQLMCQFVSNLLLSLVLLNSGFFLQKKVNVMFPSLKEMMILLSRASRMYLALFADGICSTRPCSLAAIAKA
jgi:hypothetical protein